MKKHNIGKIAGLAMAAAITMVGASNSASAALTGSVLFEDLGSGQVKVTLSNISTPTTVNISQVIYGVYWSGGATITGTDSVTFTGTQWVLNGATPVSSAQANLDVSPPWHAGNDGFGNVGLTALGGGTQGYGLIAGGSTYTSTANNKIDGLAQVGHNPLLDNTIVAILNYSGAAFGTPTNVRYGFGTAGNTIVPEPSTIVAGALLLLPFGMSTMRMLRKNRAA